MTSTADEAFEFLAQRLIRRPEGVPVKPRMLMEWVGAARRGTRVVAEIRARLAKHQLATEPDFADVHADHEILVVRTPDHREPYVDPLEEAQRRLAVGESPARVSVRQMLAWIGAERRGAQVSEALRQTIASFGLRTEPDFDSVHVDALVSLLPLEESAPDEAEHADPCAPVDANDSAPAAPQATSPKAPPPRRPTFQVGPLWSEDRTLVTVRPQTSMREAMTKMMLDGLSHLPVLSSDFNARGVVRWEDIARHLLLNDRATLDGEVGAVAQPVDTVDPDEPFLDVIPKILAQGCVLLRGADKRIVGIITLRDLGANLLRIAQPFVALADIEKILRDFIDEGEFDAAELAEVAGETQGGRPVNGVDNLSLGHAIRLLQRDDAWRRVALPVDKQAFLQRLDQVREVRNAVMHFSPDSPTPKDTETLRVFLAVMQDLGERTRSSPPEVAERPAQ